MPTRTIALFLPLALASSLTALGCDAGREHSNDAPEPLAVRDAPPSSPVTPDEVLEPREGSQRIAIADYFATEGAFRLFGIEPGDETHARSAILADTRTWSTRSYREGDFIGRGMRIARIGEGSVTLESARGNVVLGVGADAELRVVRHRLDVVARPRGRHRFALDVEAARAADATVPPTELHELYGERMLKLGPIARGSLFAEADLREGDLIAALDGAAADESTASEVARALTDGRPSVRLRVVRNGVIFEQLYAARGRSSESTR